MLRKQARLHEFIQKYKRTKGKLLLDVACGTGVHAGLLSKYYQVEGMDLDARDAQGGSQRNILKFDFIKVT